MITIAFTILLTLYLETSSAMQMPLNWDCKDSSLSFLSHCSFSIWMKRHWLFLERSFSSYHIARVRYSIGTNQSKLIIFDRRIQRFVPTPRLLHFIFLRLLLSISFVRLCAVDFLFGIFKYSNYNLVHMNVPYNYLLNLLRGRLAHG